MSKVMTQSLLELFSDIFSSTERDPPAHIVALSYEFDDQQVLNLALQKPMGEHFDPRLLHFAQIAEIVPVVIYDARKTRENNRVPHFMELLPVKAKAWTCHHSKAYMIVTRERVHLVLGSMNLTATGLFNNREVFEAFTWSQRETDDISVLVEFMQVLESGYGRLDSVPLQSAIQAVRRKISAWGVPDTDGSAWLIHQGYSDGTGLDMLVRDWRDQFGDVSPERCVAVSPFFDRGMGDAVFADKLLEAWPRLRRLDVITDDTVLASLGRTHFGSFPEVALYTIPPEVTPQERKRVSSANGGTDVSALTLTRKLHAKILVLSLGGTSLVYFGSANFTKKAWCGGNFELGLARLVSASAEQLLSMSADALGAGKADHWPELPALPPNPETAAKEDEYENLVLYPDFIQGIELAECEPAGSMHFRLSCAADTQGGINDYIVSWNGHPLTFVGGVSTLVSRELLRACLLGGRNLRFVPTRDPALLYFLPFRHDPNLFAKRDRFVFPSAEDWMLHYLGVDAEPWRDPDEYLPGDNAIPENDPSQQVQAARAGNPVIRMQQHLSLFSRIENEFIARAKLALDVPEVEQAALWDAQVAAPLQTFANVLLREPPGEDQLFKLGELVMLGRALCGFSDRARPLLRKLLSDLPEDATDPVLAEYVSFCRSEPA